MKKLILVILLTLGISGCTENMRAKQWGGTMTITLPQGMKLIEATWKAGDLWYMYRQARAGEAAETFTFREDSTWGIAEGKVIFKEDF